MKQNVYRLIFPAVMPLLFFTIALMPVEVLGCFVRGLIAMLIALISGMAALVTAVIGLKRRVRHEKNSVWWVLSTLILMIPLIAMIILA